MQELELIQKRNQLLYFLYLIGITLYITLFLKTINNLSVHFILFTVFYFGIIGLFLSKKKFARRIQPFIILGLNVSILLLNLYNFQTTNLILFIFMLIALSIYRSLFLILSMIVVSSIEIIFLIIMLYPEKSIYDIPIVNISIFATFLLCTMWFIHAIYFNKLWSNMETIAASKEKEILSREAYLKLFFEQAKDGIAVLDLDKRLIDMNPAFEELYGWKREEYIGKVFNYESPENKEAAKKRFENVLKGDSYPLIETPDMRRDGTFFDAQLSLSPIYDSDGDMIAVSVISRDIAYLKEAEKLKIQSEKLKLAGEIAAGMAHEIRNPMTVISGFVQLMNKDIDSPYYPYTKLIQSEINRIDLIISEFLVLSKPHIEKLEPISIDEVLKDTFDLFEIEFKQHNIQFEQKWQSCNFKIIGEENQMKQVFVNIIKNAIEALEEKAEQGIISLTVEKESKHFIHISIRDNGCGMTTEQLEYIFEPFYTTKPKGTGLGMMITNKIIQEHGGKIEIKSKVNEGTTIIIKLPSIEKE